MLDHVTREVEVFVPARRHPEKITVDVSELEMGKAVRVATEGAGQVTMLSEPTWSSFTWSREGRGEVAAAAAPWRRGGGGAEPEVIKKGKPPRKARPRRRPRGERRTRRPQKKEKK